jgi:hypothetical protein
MPLGLEGSSLPVRQLPLHRVERSRSLCGVALSSIVALAVLAGACSGGLSERSVAEAKGDYELPAAVERIRIEIDSGTIEIAPAEGRRVSFAGGVRRAADTAEDLARLEAVPIRLDLAPAADDPATLVVRGPAAPEGIVGVIAFEAGLRVPADLPLEVVVRHSGHVTLTDRTVTSVVTTSRGDLRFERCKAGVKGKTGAGHVIVFGHEGDLDVQVTTGAIQAFVPKPGETLRLVTGSGTVQCQVPRDLGFVLDARAEVGKIGSSFGLEPQRVGDYGAVLTGRQGDGRTKVVLRTASGHLAFSPRDSW